MKKRLVLSLPMPPDVMARAGAEFDLWAPEKPISIEKATEAAVAQQADGMLISLRLPVTPAHIAAMPASVKVLATASVGFEHIDLAACAARGIVVTNTPDVLTDATADTHMLLLLGAMRRAKEHVRNMDSGWKIQNGFAANLGWDVTGKTMGIVGMGRIGRAVAERSRGFRMPILYHNRSRLSPELESGARYFASLDEMLPHCQVLSLNLPGGGGVLMTAERFAKLPKGAVFINSARGSLVDEGAMMDALESGHLSAVGLDVFAREPQYDQRINAHPLAFLLPHIGSATVETRNAMGFTCLDNIAAVLAGKPAPNEVRV